MFTEPKAILRIVTDWEKNGAPNGFLRADTIARRLERQEVPTGPDQELLRTLARMGDEGLLDVSVNRGDGRILDVMVKGITQKGLDDL